MTEVIKAISETERPSVSLSISFVRHGEPVEYGVFSSPLSQTGIIQISGFADALIDRYKNDPMTHVIKPYFSSRERTIQSAGVLEDRIRSRLETEKLDNIRILKGRKIEALQTADPLNVLIVNGTPLNQAFETWKGLPDAVGLENPKAMVDRFRNLLKTLQDQTRRIPNGTEIDLICLTHETLLYALASTISQNVGKIGFGEEIRVDFRSDNPSLVLRGTEYKFPLE